MEKLSDIAKTVIPDLVISKRKLKQAGQLELVRSDRDAGTQPLGFSSRPFVLCGLPLRRPPAGQLLHVRRNGRFTLEVTGHPSYGLPFGQDRLLPLWVATVAKRQNSRIITFDSAAEILDTFALPKDGKTYRRLVQSFERIFGATVFFGTEQEKRASVFSQARFHFFDSARIWFSPNAGLDQTQLPEFRNVVVLSEAFWNEVSTHGVPVDLNVVRLLAAAPGQLDLYTWLAWRCWTAKRESRIPLVGEGGLIQQLGVSDQTADRRFRHRIRQWVSHIRVIWPDCPVTVDGEHLVIRPARSAIRAASV